ncbi:MAG: hypothetical protein LBH16_04460 [Treponema sp.]|jgi:hypothetical protein|nr:hypothetical protein [Treponema sp.]
MQRIHLSELDGKPVICFETGLDPRSFARTKMGSCFAEPGYIVNPDGSNTQWKAVGVTDTAGLMTVWGPPFKGDRLDLLIEAGRDSSPLASLQETLQNSLQSVVYWIRAKLLLGDTETALHPGAAFISNFDETSVTVSGASGRSDASGGSESDYPKGSVFFTPDNLSNRCLIAENDDPSCYVCPDLKGMDAAAFCAGAMLYKILNKTNPYPDLATIYEDMREGVFLPPSLASPGLNANICELIQNALLLPVAKKRTSQSGVDILGSLLKILMNKEGRAVAVSSLFYTLSAEETRQLEKEKKRYLKRLNFSVKTTRFAQSHKPVLAGAAIALIFVVFVAVTMIRSRNEMPTTAGMDSATVILTYYESFSMLNHVFMEACINGADKSDIDTATNLFVINKVRAAHEVRSGSIISARIWKENGGELPAPDVFGVTDLVITNTSGSEDQDWIHYRADYILWYPNELNSSVRTDNLKLNRDKKKNWRITEIKRTVGQF